MGVGDEVAVLDAHAVGLVDAAVTVDVCRAAVGAQRDRLDADELALPRPDAVGVARDLGQACRCDHVGVGATVAAGNEIPRRAVGIVGQIDAVAGGQIVVVARQQLHEAHTGQAAQLLEIGDLERLHDHRVALAAPVCGRQHVGELALQRQVLLLMPGRVLGFGIDTDGAAGAHGFLFRQVDDFLEGRNLEGVVEAWAARGDAFARTQLLDFGEREIRREPVVVLHAVDAGLALARGELGNCRYVGRAAEHGLVARDQHAIPGRYEVRLDEVRTHRDGGAIGLQRVLGQVARGAAVADDQRRAAV